MILNWLLIAYPCGVHWALFLNNQSLGKRIERTPGFFPTQFVQPMTVQWFLMTPRDTLHQFIAYVCTPPFNPSHQWVWFNVTTFLHTFLWIRSIPSSTECLPFINGLKSFLLQLHLFALVLCTSFVVFIIVCTCLHYMWYCLQPFSVSWKGKAIMIKRLYDIAELLSSLSLFSGPSHIKTNRVIKRSATELRAADDNQ